MSAVRGAAIWSMGGQYVAFVVNFAASVIVARYFLGPEEAGLFSLAFSAAMMLAVLQDFGLTRYIAGEREMTPERIRACFTVSLLFSLAVGVSIVAAAWPVTRFYGDERLLPLLLVIAGSYLLVPLAIVPTALVQRELDFKSMFIVTVGAALTNAAVTLTLAAMGYSAMALAWGTVGQQAARALLAMWRAGWPSPVPLTLKGARPVVGFGTGASVLAVSGALGTRSPELVIGRLLDFAAVGLYGRAMGLAGQLRHLLTGAVAGVFYPAFARLRDQGEDLAPPYVRVVACYSAVTWPAMAFLAASSLPLVLMLYGETWAGVAPLLVWIALSEMIFTALPLHMELPLLLGKMRKLVWLNLADTAASVAMLLVFAFWGLEAAAASRVAYGMLWLGIYAGFMRGLIGFSWSAMLEVHAKSLAATFATIVPLLLAYAFWKRPEEMDFATLALLAATGCVAWLATIFATHHPVRQEVIELLAAARAALPSQPKLGRG